MLGFDQVSIKPEQKMPKPPRIFHINSEGVPAVRDLGDKNYDWRDVEAKDLTPEESEVLRRWEPLWKELYSVQFRFYGGVGGPFEGQWITMQCEFDWPREEVLLPEVEAFARRFNAVVGEMSSPDSERQRRDVSVNIWNFGMLDVRKLKEDMIKALRNEPNLRNYLVCVW